MTPAHVVLIPGGTRRDADEGRASLRSCYERAAARLALAVPWVRASGVGRLTVVALRHEDLKRPRCDLYAMGEATASLCGQLLEGGVALELFGDVANLPPGLPGLGLFLERIGRRWPAPADCTVSIGINYRSGDLLATRCLPSAELVIRTGDRQTLNGILPDVAASAWIHCPPVSWLQFTHSDWISALAWYAAQRRETEG